MNTVYSGYYDYGLVALSILLSVLSAYAALDLAGRVTSVHGPKRLVWLCGGATAMGTGIWSMHYVGMEAFHLPIPVQFDWPTVLLSLLAAIFASAVALIIVSRPTMRRLRAILGSVVMGSGIAAMHYIGMAAMRLQAMCVYSPYLVALSILLAIAISYAALRLTFEARERLAPWDKRKLGIAIVMGLAIPVMHYVGMAAASFVPAASIEGSVAHAVSVSGLGLAGITAVTLLLLTAVYVSSAVDRHLSRQTLSLKESRRQLQAVFDTMTEAIVIVDCDRGIVEHNRAASILLGIGAQSVSIDKIADTFEGFSASGAPLSPEEWPIMRAIKGDFCHDSEVSIRRKDTGASVTVEISTVPVATQDGSKKIIVSLRDISERKLMDEARTRLVAIVESTDDAIIGRDVKGIVTSWNRGAQLLYGYTPEEIIGQSINVLIPEDLHEEIEQILRATAEGRSVTLDETIRRRKDGSLIQVSLAISPLKDARGNINGAAIIARDITARKKAEEALREQAHLLDSAPVFIRDLDHRVVFWPKSAEKLYGFTSQEAVGTVSHDLLQTQFSEPMAIILGKLFETDMWEGELIHRRRDGSPIIVLSTWALHRDRNGQPVSILENNIDISARKQAEAMLTAQANELASQAEGLIQSRLALETQTFMLQSVLTSISEGLVVADKNGRFIIWNPAAEKIIGLGPENLTSEQWSEHYGLYRTDMVTPFPSQEIPLAHAIQGGESTAEMYVLNRELASGKFIEASASPLRDKDGNICGGVTAFRDITERNLMDETRSRLVAIVESSEDAIIGKDLRGVVTSWNGGARKIFGYTSAEMIGQSIKILLPPDREHEEDEILGRIRLGETVDHIETQRKRKDGVLIEVSLTISPIRDANGKVVGASKIARDISEKKLMERQLHQSQKMDAIGQLTGGVAHDFNNLLGIILGNLDLLEISVAGNEAAVDQVQTAQRAATRGADLTRRLLAFARMEGLKPVSTLLNSSIQNMIALAKRALGPEITITTQLDESLPRVFVDVAGLENALLNLVVNARDAMPGGGTISVSTRLINLEENYASVKLAELKSGWYACASVSDSGQGMSKEIAERAFEPFFTTKQRDKGTGLGLAMVYGFAKQSGGTARIYSEPGKGTTVSIFMPLADVGPEQENAATELRPFVMMHGTVLVVDDEADLLKIASTYLAEMGLSALQAIDGASALAMIAREPEIDLVVTDIVMPGGMNGVELAKHVHELNPNIKLIYSSGFPADALAEMKVSLVNGPLLHKPYQRAEFRTMIRKVLEVRVAAPESKISL
jgi:PAS domain S-box-containing protein